MVDEFLIPVGFKDEVNFDTYVEHEYKNKIIEYFKINGFDLVKTPLVEFTNQKNSNNFLIETKKNENQLVHQHMNDILDKSYKENAKTIIQGLDIYSLGIVLPMTLYDLAIAKKIIGMFIVVFMFILS